MKNKRERKTEVIRRINKGFSLFVSFCMCVSSMSLTSHASKGDEEIDNEEEFSIEDIQTLIDETNFYLDVFYSDESMVSITGKEIYNSDYLPSFNVSSENVYVNKISVRVYDDQKNLIKEEVVYEEDSFENPFIFDDEEEDKQDEKNQIDGEEKGEHTGNEPTGGEGEYDKNGDIPDDENSNTEDNEQSSKEDNTSTEVLDNTNVEELPEDENETNDEIETEDENDSNDNNDNTEDENGLNNNDENPEDDIETDDDINSDDELIEENKIFKQLNSFNEWRLGLNNSFDFDDVLKIEEDGEYLIDVNVEYLSPEITLEECDNEITRMDVNFNTFTDSFSKKIIIDKTAPEINISYGDSNEGYYYNHKRNAKITISDKHLDLERTQIIINDEVLSNDCEKDVEDFISSFEYDIDFGSEGYYSGKVIAYDLFGNVSEKSIDSFCIDTSKPRIEVKITDEDKKFTNKERKAYARAYDEHLVGENEYEYVFKEGEDSYRLTVRDAAGNESYYESKSFIQDYTIPNVEIDGIESFETVNKDIEIKIQTDEKWIDRENSYVELNGYIKKDSNKYTFDSLSQNITINTESMGDDYYTLHYCITDCSGNVTKGDLRFTINKNGSSFSVNDSLKNIFGTYVKSVSNVFLSEHNLNRLIPDKLKVKFARNAKVLDLRQGIDFTVEEKVDDCGYGYVYKFNDSIFEEEGVYTISLRSEDEAGNINDTRFQSDDLTIRFGLEKDKPLQEEDDITLILVKDETEEAMETEDLPKENKEAHIEGNENIKQVKGAFLEKAEADKDEEIAENDNLEEKEEKTPFITTEDKVNPKARRIVNMIKAFLVVSIGVLAGILIRIKRKNKEKK